MPETHPGKPGAEAAGRAEQADGPEIVEAEADAGGPGEPERGVESLANEAADTGDGRLGRGEPDLGADPRQRIRPTPRRFARRPGSPTRSSSCAPRVVPRPGPARSTPIGVADQILRRDRDPAPKIRPEQARPERDDQLVRTVLVRLRADRLPAGASTTAITGSSGFCLISRRSATDDDVPGLAAMDASSQEYGDTNHGDHPRSTEGIFSRSTVHACTRS